MGSQSSAWLGLLLLAGCGGAERTHRIGPPRVVPGELKLEVPPAVRHGFAMQAPDPAASAQASLAYDLPQGWVAGAPGGMRMLSFTAPGGIDVSVTSLGGAGGGLAANLDRWREQLGLAPLTPAELAALPRRTVLGSDDAVAIDFRGAWRGGGQEIAQARMLGIVVTQPGGTLFVKAVGAATAVDAQVRAFDAFVASLRPATAAAPAAPGGAAAPPATGGDLAWSVPSGWTMEPGSAMRAVTLRPGGDRELDAYVVVLSGAAGGVAANLDRWREQLGLPKLPQAERDALPSIDVLGAPAPLFFAENGKLAVLGTVARLGQDSLFVKLVGPAAKVPQHRDAFVQFCQSLVLR